MKTFSEKVIEIVRAIPKGSVLTYREVAVQAGSPRASRAVGMIMSKNQDKGVPCHRVIRSDGTISGYNGLRGPSKAQLLEREGYRMLKT